MKKILFIVFFLPSLVYSQNDLELDLLFGSYMNDHVNKAFYVQERHWVLKNNILSYTVDVHDTRYADTLELKPADVEPLVNYMDSIEINDSIFSDLSVDYLSKTEWSIIAKGEVSRGGKKSVFKIEANSPGIMDENENVAKIKGVENILYQILEKYNN